MVSHDWWITINDQKIADNLSHAKISNVWCYLSYNIVSKMYPDLIDENSDEPLIAKIGCQNRLIETKELGKFAKATVVRYGKNITAKDFEDMTTACKYALHQSGRSTNVDVVYTVTFNEDTRIIRKDWESNVYFNGSFMGTKKYLHNNRC